jgi:phosphoserine phosphatase RsbU/P
MEELTEPNAATDLFRMELIARRQRLERAVTRSLADRQLMELLEEVDAALGRIEAGTYGLCETCHGAIESDRLIADPLIRFCLDDMSPSEQRALEQDLRLAAEIQRGLLPPRDVTANGWNVAHHFAPLGAVSGDYCDVVIGDGDGDAFFLIGDVSGKGVAAAILMGNLHAMFRTLLGTRQPIDVMLQRANRLFCESTTASHYATLVCVRASRDGDIEVANAGHCPVLLACSGGTRVLESGGLPLGMFCSSNYVLERAHLDPGDAMLLYTDGVIEARNGEDDEYGQARLVTAFERADAAGPVDARGIADLCLADLDGFRRGQPRHDDVTIMAVRRG